MGCTYTDPSNSQPTFRQSYPGSIVASDIHAYVADDPMMEMKVAIVSGTTTVAALSRGALVPSNMALVQNAGDTITGNSKVAVLSGSIATTVSLPMKVIDVVHETKDSSGDFTECIVKFNTPYSTGSAAPNVIKGGHIYMNPTGF